MARHKTAVFFLALLPYLALAVPIKPPNRIINGNVAEPGQFPYQASLRNFNWHFCGGVIIRAEWVVTAYHCVDNRTPAGVTVVVGAHHNVNGGTNVPVIRIVNHPDAFVDESTYYNISILNDISLLQTETITFGPTVAPISIGTVDLVGAGVQATISGWGNAAPEWPGFELPEYLQFMETVTLTNIDCRSRHSWLSHVVNDKNICAFSRRGQGMCHGDSGGPLVGNGQLLGIASWVEPCAQGRPDVYTRISTHLEWMMNVMDL